MTGFFSRVKFHLRRDDIFLFVAAFVVQLVLMVLTARFGNGGFLWSSDAVTYWTVAENVRDHGIFTVNPAWGPMAFRTPLYPLFLAGASAVVPGIWFAILLQNLIAAATVAIVYRLGREFLPRWGALVGATLFLLEPERLHLVNQAMSETLFLAFFLGGVWAFVRAVRTFSLRSSLVAGAAFGLATLTRPVGQIAPLLAAAFLFFLAIGRARRAAALRSALILVAAAALVVSPWIIRNGIRFDAWRISPLQGVNFYYTNIPHFLEYKAARLGIDREYFSELTDRALADLGLSFDRTSDAWVFESTRLMEFAYEPYFKERFFEVVKEDPWSYAAFHLRRSAAFFLDSGLSRTSAVIASEALPSWIFYPVFFHGGRLFWLAMLALAVLGAVRLARGANEARGLVFFWALLGIALALLAAPNRDAPRMRVPLDPLTFVLAAGGLVALRKRTEKKYMTTDSHGHSDTDLAHVYAQVPPDYWDTSLSNPIQRLYHTSRFKALRRALVSIPPSGSLLDVGCGSGWSIEQMVKGRPDIEVHGVDVAPDLIAYAAKRRPRFYVSVSKGEALAYPDARFDLVTYLDVIEHLVEPKRSLEEARRVLKPGGRVLVQVVFEHHPLFAVIWWLWMKWKGKVWDHAHLHVFDRASLRALVASAGFKIESDQVHHLGMSGIVIGRKL